MVERVAGHKLGLGEDRKSILEKYGPYVRSLAATVRKQFNAQLELEELVAYGQVGLLEAADRFDAKASLERLNRGIHSSDALNAAFAPGGFMHTYDLRPKLAAIRTPTLIIAGRHDWICAPEFSEEIHGLIPGSELRIFEQSSHSVRVDEPERLRREILAFVG